MTAGRHQGKARGLAAIRRPPIHATNVMDTRYGLPVQSEETVFRHKSRATQVAFSVARGSQRTHAKEWASQFWPAIARGLVEEYARSCVHSARFPVVMSHSYEEKWTTPPLPTLTQLLRRRLSQVESVVRVFVDREGNHLQEVWTVISRDDPVISKEVYAAEKDILAKAGEAFHIDFHVVPAEYADVESMVRAGRISIFERQE